MAVEEAPEHGNREALAAILDQPLLDLEQREIRRLVMPVRDGGPQSPFAPTASMLSSEIGGSVVARPDLPDRALFLTLEPISDERRRPEQELWAAFEAERPRILGALSVDR